MPKLIVFKFNQLIWLSETYYKKDYPIKTLNVLFLQHFTMF